MTPAGDGPARGEGRRALFSAPAAEADDSAATRARRAERSRSRTRYRSASQQRDGDGDAGRQALFSGPPRRAGTVVVECSDCDGRTPVHVLSLWRHLTPSLWVPLRAFPLWMHCPSCGRRTWCDLDWADLLPR